MIWSHNIKISCYGSLLNQFTISLINNFVASVCWITYYWEKWVTSYIEMYYALNPINFAEVQKYFYCFYFWENVKFIWWIIFFKYKKFETRSQEKVDGGGLSVIFSLWNQFTLFLINYFVASIKSLKVWDKKPRKSWWWRAFCHIFQTWRPHTLENCHTPLFAKRVYAENKFHEKTILQQI